MKLKNILSGALLLVFASFLMSYYIPREVEPDYYYNAMPREEFEAGVSLEAERNFETVGKVIRINDLVLVTEYDKGIHFIDYSNETSPSKLAFLEVPLCEDCAIKDGRLYVKSAVDLIIFDLQSNKVLNRKRNVFPQRMSGQMVMSDKEEIQIGY